MPAATRECANADRRFRQPTDDGCINAYCRSLISGVSDLWFSQQLARGSHRDLDSGMQARPQISAEEPTKGGGTIERRCRFREKIVCSVPISEQGADRPLPQRCLPASASNTLTLFARETGEHGACTFLSKILTTRRKPFRWTRRTGSTPS